MYEVLFVYKIFLNQDYYLLHILIFSCPTRFCPEKLFYWKQIEIRTHYADSIGKPSRRRMFQQQQQEQ
jgi:hypothetical protein